MASRDFLRAAVRLCSTPLDAALSRERDASRASALVASASPSAAAAWTFLVEVFSAERTALLRSCAFSFCLFRLI